MSNLLYPSFREACLTGGVDWLTDDIKVALCTASYVPSVAHTVVDDLDGIIVTSGNLSGKTATGGVADADDVTFTAVAPGDPVRSIVVFQDTGDTATSLLIACYTTTSAAVQIEVTPVGFDIAVRWSNGPTRMFRL